MLKTLLNSYQKLPIKHQKHLLAMNNHPNCIVYHPVMAEMAQKSNKSTISLKVLSPIPIHSKILMISASQSFTNKQLMGATTTDRIQLQTAFNAASKQFEILQPQQIKDLYSILIQIYANQMEISNGTMPLHQYATSLIESAKQSHYQNYQTNSKHLSSILKSNEFTIKKLYKILQQIFVKAADEKQFKSLLQIVRSRIRRIYPDNYEEVTNSDYVDALCPILQDIEQSYSPNCRIIGKYFTHLRNSYYCVESLREIKSGEFLQMRYRRGLNNYDKLLRYGAESIEKGNPDSNFMLLINPIEEEPEKILGNNVEEKLRLLKNSNLKLKNFVRIQRDGSINREDLKMLRIIFKSREGEEEGEGLKKEENLKKEKYLEKEKKLEKEESLMKEEKEKKEEYLEKDEILRKDKKEEKEEKKEKENDKQIYLYLKKNAQKMLNQKSNNNPNNNAIKIIEEQEQEIINKFLHKNSL